MVYLPLFLEYTPLLLSTQKTTSRISSIYACDNFPAQIFLSSLFKLPQLLMLSSHHDFSFKLCYFSLTTHCDIITPLGVSLNGQRLPHSQVQFLVLFPHSSSLHLHLHSMIFSESQKFRTGMDLRSRGGERKEKRRFNLYPQGPGVEKILSG